MKTQVRHFVSQRFGKCLVTLDISDDLTAMVSIARLDPERSSVAFTFEAARVAQVTGDPQLYPERLMRIAIQQAHKQFVLNGATGLFGTTIPLAVSTPPWIGDLTDAPYGGATRGYGNAPDALSQCAP